MILMDRRHASNNPAYPLLQARH